jgi:hypothetical protein
MTMILDGTSGLTTPGVVNTAGETIATTLSVTGATNLAVSSGNVGIGTASPASRLDVKSTAAGTADIRLSFSASDYMGLSSESDGYQLAAVGGTNALRFATGGTERMRIDSAGLLKFNSGYGSVATAYGCRAWVNFNGTGTVAIRASGNVSSITDNGTGDYTVNFTTAMPDANYQINSTIGVLSTAASGVSLVFTSATVPTSSLCRFASVGNASDALTDAAYFYVSIFR